MMASEGPYEPDSDDSHIPIHTFRGAAVFENEYIMHQKGTQDNLPPITFVLHRKRKERLPHLLTTDVNDDRALS